MELIIFKKLDFIKGKIVCVLGLFIFILYLSRYIFLLVIIKLKNIIFIKFIFLVLIFFKVGFNIFCINFFLIVFV